MTKDLIKVLEGLKTAQITEDGNVFLSLQKTAACTLTAEGKPYREFDFSKYKDSIRSILNSLAARGLIESGYPDYEYLHVTHEGWHYRQVLRQEFLSGLFKSVLLPVIVSLLTTLLALLLEAWLPQILK